MGYENATIGWAGAHHNQRTSERRKTEQRCSLALAGMSSRIAPLLIASMLWANAGRCQGNLVVNGGFEENSECWDSNVGWSFPYCVSWESLHGTPDYFHQCATGLWDMPANYGGFQEPYNLTDSAYAGLLTYTTWFAGAQESMIGSLSEPLLIGTKYRIRMKVSVADGVGYMTCCVGITFTSPPFPPYSENLCDVELQIPSEALDTSLWYQLDTVFTFQGGGGGQNFYIGSFRPEELSFPTIIGDTTSSESKVAYFYIDDVEIYEDTVTGIEEGLPMSEDRIRVYPNPSTGMLVVDIIMADSNDQSMSLKVTDLSGKTVYQSSMLVGMNRIELTLAPGSYLYSINDASSATFQNGKLVIVQ